MQQADFGLLFQIPGPSLVENEPSDIGPVGGEAANNSWNGVCIMLTSFAATSIFRYLGLAPFEVVRLPVLSSATVSTADWVYIDASIL